MAAFRGRSAEGIPS